MKIFEYTITLTLKIIKIYGPFTVHILSLFFMFSQPQINLLSFVVVKLKNRRRFAIMRMRLKQPPPRIRMHKTMEVTRQTAEVKTP